MQDDSEWVGVGEEIRRIATATTSTGRNIDITWTTGETVRVDLTSLIANHRAFAQLRVDDEYFRQMEVDELGWAIRWPGDGDCAIPTSELEKYAVPVGQHLGGL